MEEIKTLTSIAWWKTRSFWLGLFPGAVSALDLAFLYLAGENSGPIAAALAELFRLFGSDLTGGQITDFMQKMYPLYMAIFAQQRGLFSGKIARPYAMSAKKEDVVGTILKALPDDPPETWGVGGR